MLICCCSGQSHEASVVILQPKVTADWEANVTQCILQFDSFEFTGHYTVLLIRTLDLHYSLVSLDLVSNFNKCHFLMPYLVHFCPFWGNKLDSSYYALQPSGMLIHAQLK